MTMEMMASGFLIRRRMPSLKKVVDSAMTSCCRFSSSVAFSNFLGSSCRLSLFFLGIGLS